MLFANSNIFAWPYPLGKKDSFVSNSGLWITYCIKCGEVMGTQGWCNEYRGEMNLEGCTDTRNGRHDVWTKPINEGLLVIWGEVDEC